KPAQEAAAFDLDPLIARLRDTPPVAGGRSVLVVETGARRPNGLGHDRTPEKSLAESLTEALSPGSQTLIVDLNGPASSTDAPGLTDLVAGDAAFLDVIQSMPGSRLHRVARGFVDTEVLFEEPQALAISLDAMAEAYDWVVCRLRFRPGQASRALLSAVAARMDGVVIASNAEADDPELVALYGLAEDAGAGQVLVAQDDVVHEEASGRPALAYPDVADMPLRLSAA
ncbi:MAG TPA: lipopolysaccharide biosynthesis protein, partial [Methylobacterium sp.]|nr:lipopolysaccharide biosynthesis protein [Methylobacterium sp.]